MSETREVYNVATQPGRLLDAQVAQVMGRLSDKVLAELKQRGVGVQDENDMDGCYVGSPWENVLRYSTDLAAAMEAWEWLEEHNPWGGADADLFLGRYTNAWDNIIRQPAVIRYIDYEELGPVAIGTTYPHAISLAVVEAGRALGVIE